jgi:putative transposase
MARKLRYFVSNGYYHVYARVTRGEMIYDDPVLVDHWIRTVRSVARLFELRILGWCLMTNHIHLIIQTGDLPLWSAMSRLQVTTAKFHNLQRGVFGSLWQGRYKAKLVQEQDYLEQLFAYVHLNPVAAGLVSDPAEYENSGHRELLGGWSRRLVDTRAALAVFGINCDVARDRYLSLVRNLAEVRWIRQGIRELPWWKAVPNDHQIVTEEGAPSEATYYDGTELPEMDRDLDVTDIVARFERHRSLASGVLASRRQTTILTRERQLLTLYLVRRHSFNHCELARCLGRNPSSVSRWLNRAAELGVEDSEFRALLAELEAALPAQE